MPLVSDMFYSAARYANLLRVGQSASAAELAEFLSEANNMVDEWKTERAMVYAEKRQEFTIVPNKVSYTVGASGADWTVERPRKIEAAGLVLTNVSPAIEEPLEVNTEQEWRAISPKRMTSTLPQRLYYEPEVPLGIIYLHPVPTVANNVALYIMQVLQQFPSLGTSVTLAPAYQVAIETNLAVRLAAKYPDRQKLSPITIELARNSIAKIKALNAPTFQMRAEAGALSQQDSKRSGGRWSILTNSYMP